jgi:tRNA-splicing ligase RtcB (3'-phosphate/5'-hydroxy nucleic acid ligase)
MLHRIDPYRLRLEPEGNRLVAATVFLREGMQVEPAALQQLADVTTLDPDAFVFATPDIHSGYGVPIGAIFASRHFVSPSAVGYDINCGMRLLTTPLRAHQVDVRQLADSIRREIPLGEGKNNLSVRRASLMRIAEQGVLALGDLVEHEPALRRGYLHADWKADTACIESAGSLPGRDSAVPDRAWQRALGQLGTLGGGNHFVELQRVMRIDDSATAEQWGLFVGQLVVMIHSGSRGFGHEIGGHFMKLAAQVCRRDGLVMPNRDLAYMPLSCSEATRYLDAMHCAANFAFANRQLMAQLVRQTLRYRFGPDLQVRTLYDVPHNIAKMEKHHRAELCVHRKGATRAFPGKFMTGTPFESTGQPVLIPGSMGTASYLLAGLESGHESLYSVNHGAGRSMSRTAAAGVVRKGKIVRASGISDQAFKESMDGVYLICEDRASIKQEAPGAYKDIDAVIDTVAGAGLARVVARMTPVAVLKG